MLRRYPLIRIAGWAAVVAVLMAALAPAVSHALASRGDVRWTEVCTAEGSRRVQGAPAGKPEPQSGSQTPDPCGFCTLHADLAAPPGADGLAEPVPAGQALPIASLGATRVDPARGDAQPRAPPASA